MHVLKRDGQKQNFCENKIRQAIIKSYQSTDIQYEVEAVDELVQSVLKKIDNRDLSVEHIQELVEQTLMKKVPLVAQKYIRYRELRTQHRLSNSYLKRSIDGIINIQDNEVTSENANMSSHTPSGQMMNIASQASSDYALRYLVNDKFAKLHREGYIHIHDLDYYASKTTTCVQYDLNALFENGFYTKNGFIRPPQSIMSYATLATIVFQTNQNEQHGGQSIPAFDFAMAKGVLKSFIKHLIDIIIIQSELYNLEIDVELLKNTIKENITSIDLCAVSFTHILGFTKSRIDANTIWNLALKRVELETEQAMESFIHNLNTMHSRGGNQVVFSSINYGTDTSSEGRLVIKSLLKMTKQGLGKSEVPIFPIQIFKVKTGVNISDHDLNMAYQTLDWTNTKNFETPNFDLFLQAIETTSTSLFPNFLFLDTEFNQNPLWDAKDPLRYRYEVATMGCRTRVFEDLYGESTSMSRGNASFTSINLVRLAIEAKQKTDNQSDAILQFKNEVLKMVEQVAIQLEQRLDYQKSAKALQFPFMMRNGIWIDGATKLPNESVDEILNHSTLGIGFIGGHNAMVALLGSGHGDDQIAYQVLFDTLSLANVHIEQIKHDTKLNYALLATPAEGLSGRFTKLDKEKYGEISGVNDLDYYVNSFHIDVKTDILAIEKIIKEAPFHALTKAGHITYVEVDGEAQKNLHAILKIVEAMYRNNIGYGSINHPIDQCNQCHFKGIIYHKCPQCEGDSIRRMRRITGYLTGDLSTWNQAKKSEEKDRVKHL